MTAMLAAEYQITVYDDGTVRVVVNANSSHATRVTADPNMAAALDAALHAVALDHGLTPGITDLDAPDHFRPHTPATEQEAAQVTAMAGALTPEVVAANRRLALNDALADAAARP